MKYVEPLPFDDDQTLIDMANDNSLASYDALLRHLTRVQASYAAYVTGQGNIAAGPKPCRLPDALKDALRAHYSRAPARLAILQKIREELSPRVCPMCGSFLVGTLDHIFPKGQYPEFAFHTRNLVPACFCNSKRGEKSRDTRGGRVLHPYFDQILKQRLVRASFSGTFPTPSIGVETCCGAIPELPSVAFHLQNVILRTNIKPFMAAEWGLVLKNPFCLPELKGPVRSPDEFRAALWQVVQRFDGEFETPNNWRSVFYYGLYSNADATEYLRNRVNGIISGVIDEQSE